MKLTNANSLEAFDRIIKAYPQDKIIIVTDPPFNVGYKYKTYKDKMDETAYYDMLARFAERFPSVIIHYPEQLFKLAIRLGKAPEKVIAWVYNSNTAKQHRDVAYFGVMPDMRKVLQPYKNPNDKRIQERIKNGAGGGRLYDWWNVNQVKNVSRVKTGHPCQMPVEVMKNIVGILPDDCIIVDPFMGSGTTGVAVEIMNHEQKANRQFVGIEIDHEYFEIAKNRIEQETKPKVEQMRLAV